MGVDVRFFGAPPVSIKPAVFVDTFTTQANFENNWAATTGSSASQAGQLVQHNCSIIAGQLRFERNFNIAGQGSAMDAPLIPVSLLRTSYWSTAKSQFSEFTLNAWNTNAGSPANLVGCICCNVPNLKPVTAGLGTVYGYALILNLRNAAQGGPQYAVLQRKLGVNPDVTLQPFTNQTVNPGDVFRLRITVGSPTSHLVEVLQNGTVVFSVTTTGANLPNEGYPGLYSWTSNLLTTGDFVEFSTYAGGPL